MPIYIYDTLVEVGRDERHDFIRTGVLMFDLQPEYWSLRPESDPGPHLLNEGVISVQHDQTDGLFGHLVYGVYIMHRAGGSFHRSSVVNATTGVISVVADHDRGEAYGFHSGSASPDFINHGLLEVSSRNDAWGVYTWSGGTQANPYPTDYYWETSGFEFFNTGLIEVEAGRNAYGVMMYNGGVARNSGTISVTGAEDSWGMLLWGHYSELHNSGSIIAIDSAGPDESVGVYISAGLQDSLIVNTGVIRARYAIAEKPVPTPWFPNGTDVVDNRGEIYGDILFTYGDDRVLNSGLIVGDVTFVEGRNQFYGTHGLMEGVLRMGGGDDWAFGGYSHDRIEGEDGDDELHGGRGGDVVDGGAGRDMLWGDEGDDTLSGGDDVDVLNGGAGDDILIAAGGDHLLGGAGDDRIVLAGGADRLVLSGDAGADTVENFDLSQDRFSLGGRQFTALVQEGADTRLFHAGGSVLVRGVIGLSLVQWNALVEGRSGAAGADGANLDGSAIADVLLGEAGDDRLVGGAADDWMFGEGGDDDLRGGTGADTLQTGAGYDRADGGDGDDVIIDREGGVEASGGDGNDIVFGSDADDIMIGGAGGDVLLGAGGQDWLQGDEEADSIFGGGGDDLIFGGSGANALYGDDGDDIILGGVDGELIYGDRGRDQIDGGAGDDIIYGGGEDDVVHGRDGNDYINLGVGRDIGYGGAGNDHLLAGAFGVALYGEAGNDALDGHFGTGILLYGGEGDDTLYSSKEGFAFGGAGNDHLQGFDSVDWLQGGAGDDVIIGGNRQNDRATVDYSDVETFIRVDLSLISAQDTHGSGWDWIQNVGNLIASGGDDVVDSGFYANHVRGEGGNDILNGQGRGDLLDGGAGADRLDGGEDNDLLVGGAGDDVLVGGSGHDMAWFSGDRADSTFLTEGAETRLTGPEGVDRLSGVEILLFRDGAYDASGLLLPGSAPATSGADEIGGTSGDDLLYGGGGDDVITVLSGHDVVFGGEGLDTVVIGVNRQEFMLTRHGETTVIRGLDWVFVLTDVERVAFANQTLILNGNDGQWLAGGAGHDELFGSAGDDELVGHAGRDTLYGYDGADTLSGGAGDDVIDGGAGTDVFEVSGQPDQYAVLRNGDDFILKGPEGHDALTGVEIIRFGDGRVLELNRMYGPDVNAQAWTDGRIPEALLSRGSAGDAGGPLVMPGMDDPDLGAAKGDGRPQVLPGIGDGDQRDWKEDGGPLVLPSEDVLLVGGAKAFEGPQVLPGSDEPGLFPYDPGYLRAAWSGPMLTADEYRLVDSQHSHGGWGLDDWLF
jgi:Ca2+-binding RTX toxin-like protein